MPLPKNLYLKCSMEINRDTRIIDLTCGELEDLIKNIISNSTERVLADSDKYAYGLAGIRALFDCSKSTAARLKNGKIKAACRQYGRKIVVDKDKALKLFNS